MLEGNIIAKTFKAMAIVSIKMGHLGSMQSLKIRLIRAEGEK
jgi:hypothetical protein